MGPSGRPAAPEVSRLPPARPPGEKGTRGGGEWRKEWSTGLGRHAKAHTGLRSEGRGPLETERTEGRMGRGQAEQRDTGYTHKRASVPVPTTQQAIWIHSQHVGAHCSRLQARDFPHRATSLDLRLTTVILIDVFK
jgi:hypothetical protein